MKLQYGLVRRLKTGRYRGHAIAIPTITAATEMISLVRSSSRCSTSVMLPSGFFCRRRLRITATVPPVPPSKPRPDVRGLRDGPRVRGVRGVLLRRRAVAVRRRRRKLCGGRRRRGGLGLVVEVQAQLLADIVG